MKRLSDLLELRPRRSKLDVLSDILNIVAKGALKTQIMYRANLSFAQLNSYLNFLLDNGLIKKKNELPGSSYEITAKGQEFLDVLERLGTLLSRSENAAKDIRK